MSGKRKVGMKQITTEFMVGLVFIIAMVLLGFFTIVLTKDAGLWGQEMADVQVELTDVGGLAKGDKVLLRGLEIGKISNAEISPHDPKKIMLTATVKPEYGTFGEGYVAEIKSSSVLGGLYLYLERGDVSKPVQMPLEGKEQVDALSQVGEAARDLRNFTRLLDNKESTLYKLATTRELHDEALAAMKSVQQVGVAAEEVKAVRGDIKQALSEFENAGKSISQAGKDVSTAASKVSAAGDSVRKWSDNLDGAITDARKGKGTVGALLADDKMANDLKAAITDIRTAVSSLTGEKSSIGKMMRDDGALYTSIKGAFDDVGKTFENANEVVAHVKKGEGTFGKLFMDDTLYKDLRQTIRDVQGAINDFREQAPILTFGSFIFGSL